ncbi:MAG: zinc ribbon domain-containing protein [Victivallaceae bacterium]
MAEIMQVQCYKCQTVYEVQPELAGQRVECSVCSAKFIVPAVIPDHGDQVYATCPYIKPDQSSTTPPPDGGNSQAAVSGSEDISFLTKTVKRCRSDHTGMIPKLDDGSVIGTVVEEKVSERTATAVHKKHAGAAGSAKPGETKTVPPPARKWWQFWR